MKSKYKSAKTIILSIVLATVPKIQIAYGQSGEIRQATSSLLVTAQYVIGAIVFVNLCFTVWALVTGDSKAKNFIIGTVIGMLVWSFVYAIVEAGNSGI